MAGHSKWAQIKRKKAKTDAQKGKIYGKHVRAITITARAGADPEANAALRNAIAAAKADSVPQENIDRAIERGAGLKEGVNFEEVVYEGYGPGGVAIMVVALTDNRNRTAGEVRRTFERGGGSLGASGSVAWQFQRKGLIVLEGTSDQVIEAAIECGAEDFEPTNGVTEVYVDPGQFYRVKEALEKRGIVPQSAELTMIPQNTVRLPEDKVQQVMRLLENLEELDDVQNVYSNVDLSGVSA